MFVSVSMVVIILVRHLLTAWVGAQYAEYSYLVIILAVASLIDTSTWPAGFILQGMARHSPLASMTIGSGIANLTLSILLVNRLGLMGVALSSLIATTVICLGFVTPYAMRVIGASARDMYTKVLMPSLFPVIPMGLIMIILRELIQPASVIMILMVAAVGPLVYFSIYLFLRANEFERGVVRKLTEEIRSRMGLGAKATERS
jgi:O-antigen/teichoic acid export membrane protein